MDGIAGLLESMTNGAAPGTGILKLLSMTKKMFGGTVPSFLVDYAQSQQLSIFGDYPTHKDVAPSAIFTAVFAIFFLAHLYVFVMNYSRGHTFWLSLCYAFYSMLRFLGYGLRIRWAQDIAQIQVGLASEAFIIIPIVLLASFNLVLAQRIFTWRHPHIGSSNLFWSAMITIYVIVAGVVVMAILGAMIPYIYFLSEKHYSMCKRVSRAASILCVLYSVLALALVVGSFVFKSTKKARQVWTYQPWWIESFGVFYYVPKGACQDAEATFAMREPEAGHAVRIIATTTHYHNTLEKTKSVSSKSGKLDHNWSIAIISFTTVILLISSIFRCVSTFINSTYADQSWIFAPVVMYIMFGVLEVLVNLTYLLGRVDLRFYRPDRIKKGLAGSHHSSIGGAGTAGLGEHDTLGGSESGAENEKPLEQLSTAPALAQEADV